MTATLRTENLSKQWGAFRANSDVSLTFAPGARHALIGPNGAGKTTFINLLTGVLPPTSGDVFLGDERITTLPQFARVKRGMTRTFQINTLFPGLIVIESVVLAICERKGKAALFHRAVAQSAVRQAAAGRDRARARDAPFDPAARRAGGRHSGRRKHRALRRHRRAAARCDDRVHRARYGARVPIRGADHGD